MARCTRMGRAERDVSGSRSLRSTTYEMPWRARVSARPTEGRPAANRRCTESSARMVCGGVSGMESRTPHGLLPSTCSGSSWLVPHTWVANGAPGTTSTRPGAGVPVLCSLSQSAASCQYCGIALNVPGGVSRPVHASEVLTISAVRTTTVTATRLSRSGWANARSHTDARRAARQRYPAQQLRDAQHQRDPDHRSQLVHVAQGCAAGVQERLDLVGQRRAQPAAVAGGHQHHPDQQHRHQPSPRRHAGAGQPGQPGRRDQAGAQDGRRSGHQWRARGGGRRHERGPAVGAAQHLGQRRPLRRHAGGFDEVQERGADVAQAEPAPPPTTASPGTGPAPTTRCSATTTGSAGGMPTRSRRAGNRPASRWR